jgi:hypothetical protein
MIEWKDLLPADEVLARLGALQVDEVYIDEGAKTVWGAVAVRSLYVRESAFVLSWDYVDVQFKFEMYVASPEERSAAATSGWSLVGRVATPARICFLARAEWIRPAIPGEVPETYEQIIEEAGRVDSVPKMATIAGLGLRGVALMNDTGDLPASIIGIDDSVGYSLQWLSDRSSVEAYSADCHVVDLDALRAIRRSIGHD